MTRTGRGSAHRRGYDARWRRARLIYLANHPLCVMCKQLGRITAASVVDHKTPHKGHAVLFWDETNWQSLCASCHDSHKQSQERTGIMRGAGADGTPIDPAHPWHDQG
jgi:5-methylcytosine-specific restriction endonuclease McrA